MSRSWRQLGNSESDPTLIIGCLGGRKIEVAQGILPRVSFGEYPESLTHDAVVLHLAAMPVPEHDHCSRLRCWARRLRHLTGLLFLPQPFHFVGETIDLGAESSVVVRLRRGWVWLLGVFGIRPEERRVIEGRVRVIGAQAIVGIAEASRINEKAATGPKSRSDVFAF